MISSVLKEVFLHSRPLARNRTKKILRCNNQANERQLPVAKTSESIEPNDNNLALNAIAYTFFTTEYARSFGDRGLLAFSTEANGETEI